MTLVDRKITDTQISVNGVASAPDRLTGTAAQNKAIFDNLIKTIVKTEFNAVIDDLIATADGASGADQIGATAISGLSGTTLQVILENLQTLAAHLAGNETFTGVKTFNVSPKVPTPIADSDAVPKSYVMPLASAYTKAEIDAAISMVEGAIASINGMSNAGGNITIEDSGSGTIGVTVDAVSKKIKLSATGTSVPAHHATEHEASGADVVHLASMTYDNTISGLSATNPKSAIDELASEKMDAIAKATQAEAEAGIDDTKFMTPLKTAQEINALAPYTSHNRKHVLLETDCLVWEANAYHGSGFRNTAMQGSLLGDVYANHPGCIILCAPPAAAGYGGAIFTNGSSLKLAANDKTEFIFITAGSLTNREILLGFSNTLGGSLNNAVVIDIFQGVVSFTCAKANVLKTNSSIYTCATNTWYRATIQADSTLSSVIAKIYAENSETPLATSTIAIADVPINTGLQIYAASYANTNISGAAVVGIDYISYENTSLAR